MKILVVEDDRDIQALICTSLAKADYQTSSCIDVKTARQVVAEYKPDCMIVDWMLPGSSGLELIRWLRRQQDFAHIPVLMLTARAQEADKISGLDAGADDYMTKPMSLREMHARVKALLRRPSTYRESSDMLNTGAIVLNKATHEVRINQQPVKLSPTEYKLLKYFIENSDKVFSRDQILSAIWGDTAYIGDRTVDVHILRLRKILKKQRADDMIRTVRGVGYLFNSKPA